MSTERLLKHLLGEKQWAVIRRIGGKKGSKRNLQVDERGAPLSIIVCGANEHDVTKIAEVMDAVVMIRPSKQEENLCLDAGYVGAEKIVSDRAYVPHIRPRGEEIKETERNPSFKPRRWIVEVAHSWFNRFRKLVPRYEKTLDSCLALHHLAAAIICFRKAGIN